MRSASDGVSRDRHFSVPNYEVLGPLAEGGVAEVWLAQPKHLAGLVALKRLRKKYQHSEDHQRRLQREARIGILVDHPNVVRTVDSGVTVDGPYIATDYIPGIDLEHLSHTLARLRRPFPTQYAIQLMLEVLSGLQAIHSAKDLEGRPARIIHRDLSPRNIQVGFTGEVAIVDFGVAFARFEDLETAPGSLLGTLRYMSPEQAMGEPATRSADLFAVGTTLWELLTGRWLFNKPTKEEVLKAVATANVPPPSRINSNLPKPLDVVLMKALAHSPSDRFESAASMRQALLEAAPEWDVDSPLEIARLLAEIFPQEAKTARQRLESAAVRAAGSRHDPWQRDTELEVSDRSAKVLSADRDPAIPSLIAAPEGEAAFLEMEHVAGLKMEALRDTDTQAVPSSRAAFDEATSRMPRASRSEIAADVQRQKPEQYRDRVRLLDQFRPETSAPPPSTVLLRRVGPAPKKSGAPESTSSRNPESSRRLFVLAALIGGAAVYLMMRLQEVPMALSRFLF